MYIKIPHVGNLELTADNFSNVYFRCPVCKKETSRNTEEFFSFMTKYGYNLNEQVMCWGCCIIYAGKRADIRNVCKSIPEDELHEAALNLTKKVVKETENHVFCEV